MWRSMERAILEKKPFDEIEPRAVFRREHEAETARWLGVKPRLGFLGDMSGVVVEDQLDGGVCRISSVEPLEEADELTRTMAILDASMHLAREQVDPGEQAQSAMAFIFMIARAAGVRPRLRRQIARAVADCLDTRLLVVRDDRDV